MNTDTLSRIERLGNELGAAVREDLEMYTDAELLELLEYHLRKPHDIVLQALARNPGKLAAMAAVPLHGELLRRAEVRAMS